MRLIVGAVATRNRQAHDMHILGIERIGVTPDNGRTARHIITEFDRAALGNASTTDDIVGFLPVELWPSDRRDERRRGTRARSTRRHAVQNARRCAPAMPTWRRRIRERLRWNICC